MIFRYIMVIIPFLILVSCRDDNAGNASGFKPGRQDMEELNRYLVQKDRERIVSYAERKDLKMKEAPSGLWYKLIKEGTGEYLREGNRVIMDYECTLLDGTLCYSSVETGPKELVLGRTGIEPGMYEGLKMLKPGAEAIFILPPFLAYGLPGDGKKIPPRTVIVYHVRILDNK